MLLAGTERRGPWRLPAVGAQGREVPKAGRGQSVPAEARSALACAGRGCPGNAGVRVGAGSLLGGVCLLSRSVLNLHGMLGGEEFGFSLGTGTSQAMLHL